MSIARGRCAARLAALGGALFTVGAAGAYPAPAAQQPIVTFRDLGRMDGTYGAVAIAPGGRAFVAMDNRVALLDTSQPDSIEVMHQTGPLPEPVADIVVVGGWAWIAAGGAGLFPMSLDTDEPEPGAPIALPGAVHRLAADPPLVAAATSAGAVLVSAADPGLHVVLGAGHVTDVALGRFTAYVLQGDEVLVFDITKPAQPRAARAFRLEAAGLAIAAARNQLLVADELSALRSYSLENPRSPRRRGSVDRTYEVTKIALATDYAYLATASGVRAIQIVAEPLERNLARLQAQVVYGLAIDDTQMIVTGSRGLEVLALGPGGTPGARWGHGGRDSGRTLPIMGEAIDLSWSGSHLFAAGGGGLTVADVAQRDAPQVLARLDLAYPEPIAHLEQHILLGDGTLLYVLEVADPKQLRVVTTVSVANPVAGNEYISDIKVSDTTAFLANGRYGGLTVVDVTSPTIPVPRFVITSTGFATKLALAGPPGEQATIALVGDSQEGLIAYDIRDPFAPAKLAATGGRWYPSGLEMWGDHVVVAAGVDGMLLFEVQGVPGKPEFGRMRRVASWWPGVSARALAIQGGVAYVGGEPGSACRITAISLADPADPRQIGCWAAPEAVEAVAVAGDLMAVSAFGEGVRLVELSGAELPSTPTATATVEPPAGSTPTATPRGPAPPAPFAVFLPALGAG